MNAIDKFYIKKIEIDGLFDSSAPIQVDFSKTINCIYGANGSGKTTIINLLVSALTCDYKKLAAIKFRTLSVFVSRPSARRAIKFFVVERKKGEKSAVKLNYTFARGETYGIDGEVAEFDGAKVRETIERRFFVNHLPLYRYTDADVSVSRETDVYIRGWRAALGPSDDEELALLSDPIRRMLVVLERRFKDEYSKKQQAIRSDLENLKNKVLEKLLIDDDLVETVSRTNLKKVDISKDGYKAAKQKLDEIGLKLPQDKLEAHFSAMRRVSEELFAKREEYMAARSSNTTVERRGELYAAYSAILRIYRSLDPIHNRFMGIINDVEKSTEYRVAALKLFKNFEESVNDFFVNKEFEFTETGAFKFSCRGNPVKMEDLSSGEKHILALLGKVALSPEQDSLFIADEPELSLHLSWQRKLLPTLHKINPRMQIIVATHAPAIIPPTAQKIDLDDLNHG